MKFTAQEEYGLRCILTLARLAESDERGSGEASRAVTVAEVAEAEALSIQHAGKLIRILGKGALLESVRGCKGGYRLARPAEEIYVGEILAVLGGSIYNAEMCDRFTGDRSACVHSSDCSIRSLWSGLHAVVDRVLSQISLADLLANETDMLRWVQVHVEDIRVLTAGRES